MVNVFPQFWRSNTVFLLGSWCSSFLFFWQQIPLWQKVLFIGQNPTSDTTSDLELGTGIDGIGSPIQWINHEQVKWRTKNKNKFRTSQLRTIFSFRGVSMIRKDPCLGGCDTGGLATFLIHILIVTVSLDTGLTLPFWGHYWYHVTSSKFGQASTME